MDRTIDTMINTLAETMLTIKLDAELEEAFEDSIKGLAHLTLAETCIKQAISHLTLAVEEAK